MTIKQICDCIEAMAPAAFQEAYDNTGLLIGNAAAAAHSALICLDCTEEVVEEAIRLEAGLIIAHHPILFTGIKRLNGSNYIERTLLKAIKNDIAIFAAHTNVDNIATGVSKRMADKLGLINTRVLAPKKDLLRKLVTFVPENQLKAVQEAVFEAGCGYIGNYDSCSYFTSGTGTFRAGAGAQPFVGKINEFHTEAESRLETIFPAFLEAKVIAALKNAHPYEEPAYDIYPLSNAHPQVGSGIIGELKEEITEDTLLKNIKLAFKCKTIRHTALTGRKIKKVALCGGSGSFLLKTAMAQQADIYISADFKYHEFFDAEGKLLIADIGHYESEQFTNEIFYEVINKKFPTFALHLSKINTNPINYF